MKTTSLLIAILAVLTIPYLTNAQEDKSESTCEVKVEALEGAYTGECKNGLADGQGVAKGVDAYEGSFKKGYPHGQGRYIWANGDIHEGKWKQGKRNGIGEFIKAGEEEALRGIWKNDEFAKERIPPAYRILMQNNVNNASFMNVADHPNTVEIVFYRNGMQQRYMNDLMMEGTSGFQTQNATFLGFENVTFPFEGYITYKAPNQFQTAIVECRLKFEIEKPGRWIVKITF